MCALLRTLFTSTEVEVRCRFIFCLRFKIPTLRAFMDSQHVQIPYCFVVEVQGLLSQRKETDVFANYSFKAIFVC